MSRRAHHGPTFLVPGAWGALFGLLLIGTRVGMDVPPRLGFSIAFMGIGAVVVLAGLSMTLAPRDWKPTFVGVTVGVTALTWGIGWAPTPSSSALAMGAGLLLLSTRLGVEIGARVIESRYLWPLVIVAVGADLWSVTAPSGVTRQAIIDAPPTDAISPLLLTVPIPGVGLEGVLGVGDVVFAGFLLGMANKCGLPLRRAVTGLALGFSACLIFLQIAAVPAPALVFVGPIYAMSFGAAVAPRWTEVAQGVAFVAVIWGVGAFL